MAPIATLAARDASDANPTVVALLVALLAVSIVGVLAATTLVVLKLLRTRREARLAVEEKMSPPTLSPPTAQRSRRGHRRTVSITTHPGPKHLPTFSVSEFAASPGADIPRTGVPEIHITFPDEDRDVNEKRHSGRVVVVRISDNGGIGLAPYLDERNAADGLPPYQGDGEFMSLDIEKLGGLREKGAREWA